MKNSLLKVILLQVLIISASVATVSYINLRDISVYKSKDYIPLTEPVSFSGKSYWISQTIQTESIYNGSNLIAEKYYMTYYLSEFDGSTLRSVDFLSHNRTNYLIYPLYNLEFNQSSSFSFKLIGVGNAIYIMISESLYDMFPKGTNDSRINTSLNGYPSIHYKNNFIYRYQIKPSLELIDRFSVSSNNSNFVYNNLYSFNSTTQIFLDENGTGTDIYFIDFLDKLPVISERYPSDIPIKSTIKDDITPFNFDAYFDDIYKSYSIDLKMAQIKLVDSLGRIHITGFTYTGDRIGGEDNDPDYVLIDPRSNLTQYWQLVPPTLSNNMVKLLDFGQKTLVIVNNFRINGYYDDPRFWEFSSQYDNEYLINYRRHNVVQYQLADLANPQTRDYIQFNKTLSQTPNHTIQHPRLFEYTALNYTDRISNEYLPRFDAVRVGNQVYLSLFLFKTSEGYRGDLDGCLSSFGRDVVLQTLNIKGSQITLGSYSGTLSTLTYDDCDEKTPYDENGWTVRLFYGIFKLNPESETVYASVLAVRHMTFNSVGEVYYTYIYKL